MITRIGKDVKLAVNMLQAGELVAMPTETVYGLAGNALDSEAVLRIYEVKQRPSFNPLIIHLPDFSSIGKYVTDIPQDAILLARHFSPGPLSYLLTKSRIIPDLVTAGSDKVVVRIPSHPMALDLLSMLDFPLAAPSANIFGYVSPVSAEHVLEGLGGKIPYILDGGLCRVGLESTIVGFDDGKIIIHRIGGVTVEDIRKITGKEPVVNLSHKKPETPGQMKSHYAPSTKLIIGDVNELVAVNEEKDIAVISFMKEYHGVSNNFVLSPSGNLHEAASNLFSVLREIDKLGVDLIIAEKFPEQGIGSAINDRLSRAGS